MDPIRDGLRRARGYLAAERDTTAELWRRTGPGVLDPETGEITRPGTKIWEGLVAATPLTRADRPISDGVQTVVPDQLEIAMPVEVVPEPGDTIKFVNSVMDPSLNGKEALITEVTSGSWLAKRTATAIRRDRISDEEWARLTG